MSSWSSPTTRDVRDLVIEHCKVWNVRGLSNNNNHSGSGIVLFMVDGATVQFCEVWNTGFGFVNPGTGGPVGIWAAESSNVVFQFNESHHNRNGTGSIDGAGFDFDGGCRNCVAQYNYSHDNEGPAFLVAQYNGASLQENLTFRYNISENDALASDQGVLDPYLAGGSTTGAQRNVWFYGNTLFLKSTARYGFHRAGNAGTGIKILNNLFVTRNGVPVFSNIPPGTQILGNLYWGLDGVLKLTSTHTSLAAFRAATGHETDGGTPTGVQADPLLAAPGTVGNFAQGDTQKLTQMASFFAAYRLAAGSPAINQGIDLAAKGIASPGTRDFYNGPIPQQSVYDIGAHENGASSPPPPAGLTITLMSPGAAQLDSALAAGDAVYTAAPSHGRTPAHSRACRGSGCRTMTRRTRLPATSFFRSTRPSLCSWPMTPASPPSRPGSPVGPARAP